MYRHHHYMTMLLLMVAPALVYSQPFIEVAQQSGLTHTHSNTASQIREVLRIVSGAAAGDYDNDGDVDLFLVGGGGQRASLYENKANGHFTERAEAAGLVFQDIHQAGPVFADLNNDGWEDLLILSANRMAQQPGIDDDALINRPRVFINQADGTFAEHQDSGFQSGMQSVGAALGDLDRDGDLDALITHWNRPAGNNADEGYQLIWLNDGNGHFTDITSIALADQLPGECDAQAEGAAACFSFTPNITDINNDGWLDVLLASDFGSSALLVSQGLVNGNLHFELQKPAVISDENGMGAAVADYDNDGDMDWFVSSIWDPDPDDGNEGNWGVSGNRLYRNTGDGEFEDVTDQAGVREGFWGWGSCFADFNNDGWLDLYHENGFVSNNSAAEFEHDPARLFMSNGNGTFTQQAEISGLNHTGQGRGVICFDYDHDGDQDILVMPNNSRVLLYENQRSPADQYLQIQLQTPVQVEQINAKIRLSDLGGQQLREVTLGSNFVSNNPALQHFGLSDSVITELTVTWPDNAVLTLAQDQLEHFSGAAGLGISRHCMVNLRQTANDDPVVSVDVLTYSAEGDTLAGQNVTLTVASGPHAGMQVVMVSDTDGIVRFVLNDAGAGTDNMRFELLTDTGLHQCQGSLEWLEQAMLVDGFEAAAEAGSQSVLRK